MVYNFDYSFPYTTSVRAYYASRLTNEVKRKCNKHLQRVSRFVMSFLKKSPFFYNIFGDTKFILRV